jgi:hypothetical protein
VHDVALTDLLSGFPQTSYSGEAYRVTAAGFDPTAFSTNGGRWAPVSAGAYAVPVLYTSLEEEGAIAEVASYLALLSPPPAKPLMVHRLAITAKRVLTIGRDDFGALAIDENRYGERNYGRTQEIGAAISFLQCDGLIAPSARWPCNNLILFGDNHALGETLEPIDSRSIEWQAWARQHRLLG